MSNFEYILESDNSREIEYKITFESDGEVIFLEVSTCSAKPRLWKQIPPRIAYDLQGFEDAQAEAVAHFTDLSAEDEAEHVAWDNERIVRGIGMQ